MSTWVRGWPDTVSINWSGIVSLRVRSQRLTYRWAVSSIVDTPSKQSMLLNEGRLNGRLGQMNSIQVSKSTIIRVCKILNHSFHGWQTLVPVMSWAVDLTANWSEHHSRSGTFKWLTGIILCKATSCMRNNYIANHGQNGRSSLVLYSPLLQIMRLGQTAPSLEHSG